MIPKISPVKFIWEKYVAKVGVSLSQILTDRYMVDGFLSLKPDVEVLGWCPSKDIPIRPRTYGFVLLATFKDHDWTGEQFWFHVTFLPKNCEGADLTP